ncbi:MAG: 16S rRNA (adenine(1518)-N(6)/adenine(1519)-N(6))-dimethyltransferase, partial [Acidobacteria bacterium]|nr:16S rRNA (adenine(1518)-N(6)/adenine(1519)-N(6))-dimethyltransferase [Acidobacteriota bacterium]
IIIGLEPIASDQVLDSQTLDFTEKVARTAFSQRRKMLKNTMAQFFGTMSTEQIPIDLTRRPETLSPEEFIDLSRFLMQRGKP